jgi:hypothetical protein
VGNRSILLHPIFTIHSNRKMQEQSPCALISEISFVDQDQMKHDGNDSESSLGSTEVLDIDQEVIPQEDRSYMNPKERILPNVVDSESLSNELQSPSCKDTTSSKDMISELKTYRQIIAKLKDENDNFRKKTTEQRYTIESLEKRLQEVQHRRIPTDSNDLKHLQDELEIKTGMIENEMLKSASMEKGILDLQVKIASLGEKVIQLENANEKLEQEKQVLQKLLSTSREIALNKSLLDRSADKSLNMSILDRSLMDKSVDVDTNLCSEDVDISRDSSTTNQSTLVIESLRKELDATKGRENELRQQLEKLMNKREGSDSIMDKISDSQQEAITYLSSEIQELRLQLEQEEAKVAGYIEKSLSHQDTIQVLEEENQAVASQILQRDRQLEMLRQDLSMKLGENACLRDEIVELEQRLQNMEPIDNGNSKLQGEYKVIKKGSSSPNRTLSLGREVIKTPERRMRRNDSETELSLMTIEMDNVDQAHAEIIESFKQNENDNNLNATKKFDILKKAIKQKYEKKIQNLKETLSTREDEVKELKRILKIRESELHKSQENAEDLEIKRVFMEAEMNQETEGLRTALKDRCLQIERLRKALLRLQSETGNNISQSNLRAISDLLIDGVGAGVDYIGSFMSSFDAEDNIGKS